MVLKGVHGSGWWVLLEDENKVDIRLCLQDLCVHVMSSYMKTLRVISFDVLIHSDLPRNLFEADW